MTKGYKATYNYKCKNQTYEIGQEYKLDEKPILCQSGFHYCLNAENTLSYYPLMPDFKLLEIEDLSNDTITIVNKSCSNHIRIVREITDKKELYELLGQEKTYNEFGKELTYKNSDGYWREFSYNENGKELTYKDSYENWYEKTYDQNGNQLSYKDSTGGYWYEKNQDSTMTKGYKATHNYQCRNQTYEVGQEYILDQIPKICQYGFHYCKDAKHTLDYYDYNKDFKLLEIEDLSSDTVTDYDKSCSNHIRIIREITDPEELLQLLYRFYTYDKNGNELTYKDSTGYFSEYTYAEDGQELTYKGSNGYWREYTYDKNGNELTYKNSTGYYCEKTYTKSGKQLTCKDSTGYWSEFTYDENGNLLSCKDSNDN